MLKKTKLAIQAWMALTLCLASVAMAANPQQEEGHVPISGIFVTNAAEELNDVETSSGHKAQSAALAALLVSVFIVIGAGRTYSQLHSQVQAELVSVQQQRTAIIHDSVKIHDSEVVEILSECEIIENEIANLEYQLNQVQREA